MKFSGLDAFSVASSLQSNSQKNRTLSLVAEPGYEQRESSSVSGRVNGELAGHPIGQHGNEALTDSILKLAGSLSESPDDIE